ncbi:MAG TPA: hypothetical protein VNA30_01840 [Mycobacteriales bacterium]|nr:hypothetical protein [Mycobacteriales bacterium]
MQVYAYSRPSTTYRLVQQAETGPDGALRFTIGPATNTRLYAQQQGCGPGASTVLSVRTVLSINARRVSPRTYLFFGTTSPSRADQLVTLYRVASGGGLVRTAQTRTRADGTYALTRRFSGSGRATFLSKTNEDLTNASGSSRSRPTVIH